jgi:hypothetical protein
MKTTEELQKEYDALIVEYNAIKRLISDAQIAEKRLSELNDRWGKPGLISNTKNALNESKFPIFSESEFTVTRIISIDKKWITLKDDGIYNKPCRYKKENGWLERNRNGEYAINYEKAIEIWNEHQKNTAVTANTGNAIK